MCAATLPVPVKVPDGEEDEEERRQKKKQEQKTLMARDLRLVNRCQQEHI